MFLQWLSSSLKKFSHSIGDHLHPPKSLERLKGRVLFEVVSLRKKSLLICLAVFLAANLPSYVVPIKCDLEFSALDASMSANSSFEETFLVDSKWSPLYWPLVSLEEVFKDYALVLPKPNLFCLLACLFILYVCYLFRFLSLLRMRCSQLDATSHFREILSSWDLSEVSESNADSRLAKNYAGIKQQLRFNWRRWSGMGLASSGVINLLLVMLMVALIYFGVIDAGAQRKYVRLSGDANKYYLVSLGFYAIVRHIIPLFLYLVRGVGYQVSECRVNFFAGRVFFVMLSSYLTLLFSLLSEFPLRWPAVLKHHLYLHILLDFCTTPWKLLFACLPDRAAVRINRLLPRIHPFDAFTAHEDVAAFAINLFVFLAVLSLSRALAVLALLNLAVSYLSVWALSFCAPPVHADLYYASNVRFLEACFTLVQLTFALLAQLFLLLPHLRQCEPLTAYLTLPASASDLIPRLFTASNLVYCACVALLLLVLLRSSIRGHCLRMEAGYLRRHLEDINQDKHYQVMKQKQWYPFCKCHESRTRKTKTNVSGSSHRRSSAKVHNG